MDSTYDIKVERKGIWLVICKFNLYFASLPNRCFSKVSENPLRVGRFDSLFLQNVSVVYVRKPKTQKWGVFSLFPPPKMA